MGHRPPPPPPQRRLDRLRDLYADGEIDLPDLERHVETTLRGGQPVRADGLPLMADPTLQAPPRPRRALPPAYLYR